MYSIIYYFHPTIFKC